MKQQRKRGDREEKETAGHRTPAKKGRKKSQTLPQMRHSCKSDSQTLEETRPSFLGWRKLCSLTCSLSIYTLTTSPAETRN